MATEAEKQQAAKLIESGQIGTTINVYNPNTGDIAKTYSSPQEAWKAGVIESPTLAGISGTHYAYASGDGFTYEEPAEVKVALNKSTGKITVKAPSFAIDHPAFQEAIKDLPTLAQNYKADPDYAYPHQDPEKAKAGETQTIDDILEMLNSTDENEKRSLNVTVKAIKEQYDWRDNIAMDMTKKPEGEETQEQYDKRMLRRQNLLNMSPEDIITANTVAVGDKVPDDTRQAISNLPSAEFLRRGKTYDEEGGTAEIKDIRETGYNLSDTSLEERRTLQADLERYLATSDFSDTDEFARNLATYKLLLQTDPDATWWQGTGLVLEGIIGGAGTTLGNIITRTGRAVNSIPIIGDLLNAPFEMGMKIANVISGGTVSNNIAKQDLANLVETMQMDGGQAPGIDPEDLRMIDFLDAWWSTTQDEYQEQLDVNASYAKTVSDISSVLTEIVLICGASGALSKAAVSGLSRVSAVAKVMSDAEAAVEAAATVGKIAPVLTKGAQILTSILSPKASAQLFTAISKIADVGVTKAVAGFVGDALGEALVHQPDDLVNVLLQKDLSPEARSDLMWNVAGNAGVAAITLGTSKTLYAIGKTKAGMAVSANWSKAINRLSVGVGDTLDAIRIAVSHHPDMESLINSVKDGGKASRMYQQRALRELRRKVAESPSVSWVGRSKEEVLKDLAKVQENIVNLQMYERAMDSALRNGQDIISVWEHSAKYGNFQSAAKTLKSSADDLFKAQKAAGRKLSKSKDGVTKTFTQEASNYIEATGRLAYEKNWLRIEGKTADKAVVKAHKSQQEELQGMIDTFKKIATPEELAAANNYIASYKNWSREWQDLLAMDGLLSADDLASLRASGYWGKDGADYMMTSRQIDAPERYLVNSDGSITTKGTSEIEHYSATATGDFVDPNVAIALEMRAQATTLSTMRQARALVNSGLATVEVSSKEARLVAKAKPFMNDLKKLSSNMVKEVAEQSRTEGAFRQFKKLSDISKNAQKVRAKANRTGGKIAESIGNFTDDQIDELFTAAHDGYNSVEDFFTANAVDGDFGTALSKSEKQFLEKRFADATQYNPKIKLDKKGKPEMTLDNYKAAKEVNDTLDAELKRAYCMGSDTVRSNPKLSSMLDDAEEAEKLMAQVTQFGEEMAEYEQWAGKIGVSASEMDDALNSIIDDVLDGFLKEGTPSAQAIQNLVEHYGIDDDLAKRWFAMQAVKENSKAICEHVEQTFKAMLEKEFPKMTQAEAKKVQKELGRWSKNIIDSQYNNLRYTMQDYFPELVDKQSVYKEIQELSDKITKTKGRANVVAVNNMEDGSEMLLKADPLIAKSLKTKAPAKQMGALQKFNYLVSKLYRMGTTGIAIKSMVSQTFRDYGGSFILGGAYKSWQKCADELAEVFGSNVAHYISQFDPPTQRALQELAEKEGKSLGEVMADEVLGIGKAESPAATQTEALRMAKRNRQLQYRNGTVNRDWTDKMSDGIEKMTDIAGKPHEIRERHNRQLVYANSMSDALKRGLSIEDAKIWAGYFMDNATTNFNRTMVHLGNLQQTVPYLGAAVNGTKSFWRLFAIDPVGVMGRITGGLIIPAMALTIYSMQSEENRKVWKNIPEYTKNENICVVVDGQMFTIPIPQEIGFIVNPFRQMVEGMYNTNRHALWELAANDLIGISPIDLDGFLAIDSANNFSMGFPERMQSGVSRLWAQLTPAPIKSLAMAVTGYDPYTGNKIDKSYTTIDPDTGQAVVMDYKSGSAAKLIASLFEKAGIDVPAPMAQAILNNTFGQASVDVMDAVTTWAQAIVPGGVTPEDWTEPFGTPFKRMAEPLYSEVYDRGEMAWSSAISQLYDKKEKILMSDEWRNYQIQLAQATTEEQRQKLATTRANIIDPFYKEVKDTIEGVRQAYGMNFTVTKFASVLSLMNTAVSTADVGVYGETLNNELFLQGRSAAIATMQSLGFPSAEGTSILGVVRTGNDGTPHIQYSSPLEILATEQIIYGASNAHYVSVKKIIEDKGLKEEKDAVWDKIKAAKTTAQKDAIKEDWDTKVFVAISPYIAQYSPEAVLSSTKLMDYLDEYFLVPNSYMKYKGRSVYSPNLDRQRGFARAFIKDMYGVK